MLKATAILLATAAAVASLYLVKSALGINMMAGPSPFHDWLYPLLGRG